MKIQTTMSWLCLLLSRIGVNLHIYDMDNIDETNMGGQLYRISDIGKLKTEAVADICNVFTNEHCSTYELYTEDSLYSPIMISCFDNIKARRLMFENWAKSSEKVLFLDGRMLAESFQIFAVLPGAEDRYRETLFDDSEVQEQPCSAKATSHCGAMISSMMVGILTNYLSNVATNMNIREVPFKTTFEIPLLTFNITTYGEL